MGTFELTLPYPPSVNHYWRAFMRSTGRIDFALGARGKTFRRTVATHVMLAKSQAKEQRVKLPLRGPLFLHAFVYPPDKRKRDLDNILKALLDALQHTGVIEDDGDISLILVKRCKPSRPAGHVHVMLSPTL